MDTFTHCLAGASIAKAGFSDRLGKIAIITAVAVSFLPDADVVMRIFAEYDPAVFIKFHRGLGNSLLLMIPLALATALIFNRISRKKAFGQFFLLSLLAIAAHNFMDLQTSYGTMLLFPFADTRFGLDLVFIIDFFYSGILVVGLIFSFLWKRQARWVSRITLVLVALYTGLCALNHSRALSAAHEFVADNDIAAVEVASLPQPLSPFLWANYVETNELVFQGFVDLWGGQHSAHSDTFVGRYQSRFRTLREARYRSYVKFPDSPLVKKALDLEGVELFLWFARFPIVLSEEIHNDRHILRLFDLRFYSIEGRFPFLYEIVFDPEGNVESEGFKRF